VVTDFLAVLSDEGSLAKHTFISNYSHGEVIDSHTVVLTTHYFWGHVAWSSTGLAGVVGGEDASDAEILQAESDEQVKLIRTPNQIEAVMAHMEKRRPNFVD